MWVCPGDQGVWFVRATYFVEYQFPSVLLDVKTSGRGHHHVYEVMRIACKKMENGSE